MRHYWATTLGVKKAALNTQPSWLGVCVCTFSKEVKSVLFRGDLFHELHDGTPLLFHLQDFACRVLEPEYLPWFAFRFYFIWWAGGPGPLCQAWSNEARHNGGCNLGRQIVYLQHEHGHGDQTMFGWGPSWFSCFKLLVYNYKGTSAFMTSALDALVFVQVCVCENT